MTQATYENSPALDALLRSLWKDVEPGEQASAHAGGYAPNSSSGYTPGRIEELRAGDPPYQSATQVNPYPYPNSTIPYTASDAFREAQEAKAEAKDLREQVALLHEALQGHQQSLELLRDLFDLVPPMIGEVANKVDSEMVALEELLTERAEMLELKLDENQFSDELVQDRLADLEADAFGLRKEEAPAEVKRYATDITQDGIHIDLIDDGTLREQLMEVVDTLNLFHCEPRLPEYLSPIKRFINGTCTGSEADHIRQIAYALNEQERDQLDDWIDHIFEAPDEYFYHFEPEEFTQLAVYYIVVKVIGECESRKMLAHIRRELAEE